MLGQLEQIPDPRDPRKRRHKLTALLLYGLLMFVFQFSSRRETNREISRPQFMTTLQLLFPEIDTLPHADTLFRLLRDIDLEHLEQAHVDLIKRLIRGKSFRRYLINRCYPIAIDGSQKLAGDTLWAEELLQRTVGKEETRHTQYFVYLLEASLAFHNGLVIPLLSEFLEHALGDSEAQKQDGELRGFVRLSDRLKTLFPRPADPAPARWPLRQRAGDAALPWLPLAVHDRAQGQGFVHGLAGVPRAPCPETASLAALLGTTPTALQLGQRHRLCLRFERASASQAERSGL
ncbi:MAG: transposase family protein [Candidatus Accumulibacter sp.]|uniref:Transposase family protein n=1 Tax=Candidatus Accumulibacter affinis TaxID=2954384 RepID=A0A935W8G6_9PROT|nr:transposase family protein [Candidatus Accumulibacter affinis]